MSTRSGFAERSRLSRIQADSEPTEVAQPTSQLLPIRGCCTGLPQSRAQSPICIGRGQAGATMVRGLARGGLLGVVHDVPLHRFVIGGYTRDGDAEPGSRCKSDMVLATVTRGLEPHVATGLPGLGRRGESAPTWESGDRLHRRVVPIHERAGVPADHVCAHRPGCRPRAVAAGVACCCRRRDCLLCRGTTPSLHHRGAIHDRVHL